MGRATTSRGTEDSQPTVKQRVIDWVRCRDYEHMRRSVTPSSLSKTTADHRRRSIGCHHWVNL
jgi:hypothetical protein